jgi:hypothetical protein
LKEFLESLENFRIFEKEVLGFAKMFRSFLKFSGNSILGV